MAEQPGRDRGEHSGDAAMDATLDARSLDALAQTQQADFKGPSGQGKLLGASTIGRFMLLRKLGEGGMGEVFSAYDEQLDRRVAIKVLHASSETEETQKRLLREAQALARIAHPNVVAIYEVGQTGGDVFAVMEHIDGQTLRDWQAEGHTAEEILSAYQMAGRGLAAVHAAGMVHRDFKPANAMVDREGRVRLLDFGLAHARGALPEKPGNENAIAGQSVLDAKLTVTGSLVGTPAYMSPEQLTNDTVGAASDQWSYCVALYEALYGTHPFLGDTISGLIANVLAGKPKAAPERPDIPPAVVEAIKRGLHVDPAARFESMQALLVALAEERAPDPSGQKRERIVVGALILVSMIGSYGYSALIDDGQFSVGRHMLPPALVLATLLGGVLFLYRNTLLRNPFHRSRLLAILLVGLFVIASRLAGVRNGEEMAVVASRDIMIVATGVGMATLCIKPQTWLTRLAGALPALGTLAIVHSVKNLEIAAVVSLDGTILVFLIAWARSAQQASATEAAKTRAKTAAQSSTSSIPSGRSG